MKIVFKSKSLDISYQRLQGRQNILASLFPCFTSNYILTYWRLFLVLFFTYQLNAAVADDNEKYFEVGVAWQGRSVMPEMVLSGFEEIIRNKAPQIRLEIHKELPDMAALDSVIGGFEKTKHAMVILRSNGTRLLVERGVAIPAFIGGVNNPVELGAAKSLNQPIANLTGVTFSLPAGIKFGTITQIFPGVKKYVLLVEDGHPGSVIDAKETELFAAEMGIAGRTIFCKTVADACNAVATVGDDEVIILGVQALITDFLPQIIECAPNNIFFGYSAHTVTAGAVAGLVADDQKLGKILGTMVIDHLINNVPVSAMPIQTDPKPKLIFNYDAVEKFRHKIPYAILDLVRSQHILENLLSHAPTGIYKSTNREITFVNDYILSITGYNREELTGRSTRIFYYDNAEYDRARSDLITQLSESDFFSGVYKWKHKNGTPLIMRLSISGAGAFSTDGEYIVTAVDITDQLRFEEELTKRKDAANLVLTLFTLTLLVLATILLVLLRQRNKANKELNENRRQFISLFTNAADPVFIAEKETGILLDVNKAGEKLMQLSSEKIIGMHQSKLHPTESIESHKESFIRHRRELINDGATSPIESNVVRADNSIVPVEVMASMVTYNNRECIMGTFRDISERKKAQSELFKSEEMHRSLLLAVPDVIVRTDISSNIIYINEHGINLIGGAPKEEIIGKNMFSFIANEDLERAKTNTYLMFHGNPGVREYKLKLGGSGYFHAEVNGEVVRDNEGNPIGMVYIIRDVTERKLAEKERLEKEQLQKKIEITEISLKFKQNFLANMSHEIRTPLTGILGMIDILEQTQLNESQKDYLSTLKSSGDNLRSIINQVLDFSKIEAGRIQIHPVVFEFKSIITNAEILFKTSLKNNVTLSSTIDPLIPPFIEADRFRLSQVLNNLVSNAIKFTNDGMISINAYFVEYQLKNTHVVVKIEVSDTGIGISPDQQSKLFEPFSQVDIEDTRQYEGTGLGLSICKQLINLMGGSIGAISDTGKGSKFWFTFPAKVAGQPFMQKNKPATLKHVKKLNILLAEDKVVNQKVIKLILNSMGHNVHIVNNGLEAIESFEPGKFDLILMDIQMPVMDGIVSANTLREKFDYLPPIVGLSANAFEGDREKYMALGMDDYLTKPVKKEDFAGLLIRCMKSGLLSG